MTRYVIATALLLGACATTSPSKGAATPTAASGQTPPAASNEPPRQKPPAPPQVGQVSLGWDSPGTGWIARRDVPQENPGASPIPLLLLYPKYKIVIINLFYPSAMGSVADMLAGERADATKSGWTCSEAVLAPGGDSGTFTCEVVKEKRTVRNKLVVQRLKGRPDITIESLGFWERDDAPMPADMDVITGSIHAVK